MSSPGYPISYIDPIKGHFSTLHELVSQEGLPGQPLFLCQIWVIENGLSQPFKVSLDLLD